MRITSHSFKHDKLISRLYSIHLHITVANVLFSHNLQVERCYYTYSIVIYNKGPGNGIIMLRIQKKIFIDIFGVYFRVRGVATYTSGELAESLPVFAVRTNTNTESCI